MSSGTRCPVLTDSSFLFGPRDDYRHLTRGAGAGGVGSEKARTVTLPTPKTTSPSGPRPAPMEQQQRGAPLLDHQTPGELGRVEDGHRDVGGEADVTAPRLQGDVLVRQRRGPAVDES